MAVLTLGALALSGAQEAPAPAPPAAPASSRQVSPETVIATVNGTPVSQAQLEMHFTQFMTSFGEEMQSEDREAYQEQASRQAMALALKSALIRDLGTGQGLDPTPEQVRATRQELHRIMGLESREQFDELLRQRGIPEREVETFIKSHLINLELFQTYTEDNPTTVTQVMARLFFDRNPALHRRPEQAQLRHIVILAAGLSADEKAQKRAKAEETLAALREGADFAATAVAVSDEPAGQQGGMHGWVSQKDLLPELGQAAFQLEPGQISGVIESDIGYHILKVEARRPEELLSYERVAPALIPQMQMQLERTKYQEWLDLRLKDAEIVDMLNPDE